MNLQGKRLLALGGNPWIDSIVQYTKSNGIKLIAAGNNPNSPIFKYADERYEIDSTDSERMKALIADQHIDGVYLGATEPVIAAACEYVNEMGLPCYCTKHTWNRLQNKAEFKKLCNQFDLPTVNSFKVEELECSDIIYPLVVKPVDGSGSKGMSVCHNYEEVINGYEAAKKISPSGKAIIEQFVNNSGFCALYTISNGDAIFGALETKYPVFYEKSKSYVGGVYLSQSKYKEEFRKLFDEKIAALVQSLGIRSGSFWIEVFYDEGKYYFNEAGFRYGGEMSMFPVQYFSQTNQVAADIYFALTGESKIDGFPSLLNETPHKKYYCIYPLHAKPGKITEILGVDKIRARPNVVAFFQKYSCGDCIHETGSFGQIFALCHFVFDDLKECAEMLYQIHNEIRIQNEEGVNLLNQMLDFESISVPF